MLRDRFLPVFLAAGLAACGDSSPHPADDAGATTEPDAGPDGAAIAATVITPRFDPTLAPHPIDSDTWLGFPFPSDHRRVDGHPRFDDFPNPTRYDQLAEWLSEAQATLDGFSTQGLVYLTFDGDLDPSTFPSTPEGFTEGTSPIWLVDVDPASPEHGRLVPLRYHYWDLADRPDGSYVTKHTLGIGPAWGFPLREHTTYALVVRDTVQGVGGATVVQPPLVRALLRDDASVPAVVPPVGQPLYDTLRGQWAGLRAWLGDASVPTSSVVVATVFTTQTVTAPLAAIADQIANDLPAPTQVGPFVAQSGGHAYRSASFQWNSTDTVQYAIYEGTYVAPNYQEGTIPYAESGGALHFVAGEPAKVADEAISFVLTVPSAPPDPARGCYPIVLYAHGTGGSRNSFLGDRTAARLAARGIAGISIDQPLHGVRNGGQSFDVDLMTFNFYNASSFRSNFRQGAIDLMSQTRFVREALAVSAADSHTGSALAFCPAHVGYMGHSQGGLTGALGLPFLPDVESFVLSGAGGGLGITIMERKDIVDFGAVFAVSFDVPLEEHWDEAHPLITLIQTLAEVSDPTSYARYWSRDARYRTAANVMLTNGRYDEATPYRTAIALAVEARLPVTTPVVIPIPEYAWVGMTPATPPLMQNAGGKTFGFLQFTWDPADTSPAHADYATHFLVFYRPEAIDASMHFLETGTGADGLAVLRRNDAADVR